MIEPGALFYFAGGRLAYSMVERRDPPFVFADALAGAAFSLLYFFPFSSLKPGASAAVVFLGYMLTGILPYSIVRKVPAEAAGTVEDTGTKPHVWLGIINTSWLSVMGITAAAIVMFQQLGVVGAPLPALGFSKEYYGALIDETLFFLDTVINAAFVLGTGLSVCMAILWSGEIWRKRDPASKSQYCAHTRASIKMVVAFLVVIGAAILFVAEPLYRRLGSLHSLLK
jgi:hypothetical protein